VPFLLTPSALLVLLVGSAVWPAETTLFACAWFYWLVSLTSLVQEVIALGLEAD
jgi:hypothetical protein